MSGHPPPEVEPPTVQECMSRINAAAEQISRIAAGMRARSEQAQRRSPWRMVWETVELPLAMAFGFVACAGLTYLSSTSGVGLPWAP